MASNIREELLMTQCILISKYTGKKYHFQSATAASEFLEHHKSYVTQCLLTERQIKHKHTGEKFDIEYKKIEIESQGKGNGGSKPHIQPCTTCKNAVCGCEWSEEFKPVPGWVAEPTIIGRLSYNIPSYRIISCPKYDEG